MAVTNRKRLLLLALFLEMLKVYNEILHRHRHHHHHHHHYSDSHAHHHCRMLITWRKAFWKTFFWFYSIWWFWLSFFHYLFFVTFYIICFESLLTLNRDFCCRCAWHGMGHVYDANPSMQTHTERDLHATFLDVIFCMYITVVHSKLY